MMDYILGLILFMPLLVTLLFTRAMNKSEFVSFKTTKGQLTVRRSDIKRVAPGELTKLPILFYYVNGSENTAVIKNSKYQIRRILK